MSKSRNPYPSDVSYDEWALVAPYLTLLPEGSAQRSYRLREVFNGLRYIVKTVPPPPTIAPRSAASPRPSRPQLTRASRSLSSTRGIRATTPGPPPLSTASNSPSSNSRRPSAASSFCPDVGSSNVPLLGPPAFEDSSKTTSAAPQLSPTFILSPSSASCSKTSLSWQQVPNRL